MPPICHPLPRIFEGREYYGVSDIVKIVGVARKTVAYWHQQGLFLADKRTHDGVYLYEVERVMQLKSVYHKNWMRGGYEPSPTTTAVAPEPTITTVEPEPAEGKKYYDAEDVAKNFDIATLLNAVLCATILLAKEAFRSQGTAFNI